MHFFKYIESTKPAREAVMPLDDQGIEGLLKKSKEMTERLSRFFTCICIHCGKCGTEQLFSGKKYEEMSDIEVMTGEVLDLLGD